MGSYTTNFLWNHPKPGDGLYNYSDGMINTPDTPATLTFTGGLLNTDAANNFSLFSHANAAESDNGQYLQYLMDKENFNYNALYGDNYSDLKIPRRKTEGILMGLPRHNMRDISGEVGEYNNIVKLPPTGRNMRDIAGEANLQELGTEHSIIAPDKKRSFSLPTFGLSGILKGLKNQFQRPEEKQAAYEAIMGDRGSLGNWESQLGQYGGNQYQLTNTPTGLKVGSDILGYGEGYEKNFDSAFGSKSLEEMEQKKIDWALGRLAKFKDKKGLGISQSLFNVLKSKGILDEQGGKIERPTTDRAKIEAYTGRPMSDYRASRPASERSFTGHGRSGMGRDPSDRMAYGGRVGYNEGGRVGILSVF